MISEQDFDRLSAYIDHQLSAAEKSALEARLLTDPELKAALRDLRLQARAIRDLPTVKAPRTFTLTAKQAEALRPLKRSWLNNLFPSLRLATALSAFAFVAVLATSFLQQPAVLQTASAPAAVEMEKSAAPQSQDSGGAAIAPAEDTGAQLSLSAAVTTTAEAVVGVAGVDPFTTTQVAEYASTPEVASPNLAPGAGEATARESLPAAANAEPAAVTPERRVVPVSGLQLAAIGLGLVTAILAIVTWLARR
jgi:hypothetical protein